MSFMGNRANGERVGGLLTAEAESAILCSEFLQSILFPMPTHDPVPPSSGPPPDIGAASRRPVIAALVITLALIVWFYGFEARYGSEYHQSAFKWIWRAWNGDTDYEHGPLFPLVIAGLIWHRFDQLKAAVGKPCGWGLLVVLLGAAFYAIGYRTLQPRVTMGAFPVILWGGAAYLWGWAVARKLLFPLFFFLLAIPLPNFQQATTHLQLIATSMAHHGSALFGVQTVVQGTAISSVHGGWDPLEIAKGCSGIRSLMALLMIAAAWAYVAKMALWKRALLFLSAFPLAILGNALRVVSIFVIGEYYDPVWARKTWHDWSGLLLFYPITLLALLTIHSLLEGGLPWKKGRRRELLRTVSQRKGELSPPRNENPPAIQES
jgi:exosortase